MRATRGLFGFLIVVVLLADGQEEMLLESKVGIHDEQGYLAVDLIGLEVSGTLIATTILNHLIPVATNNEGQRIIHAMPIRALHHILQG